LRLKKGESSGIKARIEFRTYIPQTANLQVIPESTHTYLVVHDLSGQAEMDKLAAELKNTLAELLIAKEKAEEGDRLKSAFLQNISHEVRTPLNAIMGFGDILSQPGISPEEKKLYGPMLKSSSTRLLNTITDYMDIAQLLSGNIKTNFSKIEIGKVLKTTVRKYEQTLKSTEVKFSTRFQKDIEKIQIETDESHLLKCLNHLLDNAVKFTSKGYITLGCRINRNKLIFYVKDTGIGISESARDLIFKIFQQEDMSTKRSFEGNGIGLSIVSELVRLLDGEVYFNSAKGTGSTFYLILPCKIHGATVKSERVINPFKSRVPVILIVDDDQPNRFLLEHILREDTKTIYAATDGLEALEIFRNHPEIDLVIMDLKMPKMDGITAARELKKLRKDLPVIALTAYIEEHDEKMLLEAGFSDFLAKPLQYHELHDKIILALS
jgi:signal transduction histidine kinase